MPVWETGRYLVQSVNNREERDGKMLYRVVWSDKSSTWEPRQNLLRDGCAADIRLIDEWKLSKIVDFNQYCKTKNIEIGESTQNDCAFTALQLAVTQLGNLKWYSTELVKEFYKRQKIHLNAKPAWILIKNFIQFANTKAKKRKVKEIWYKTMETNLINKTINSFEKLNYMFFPDGVYICATLNRIRIGHCFTINIENNEKFACDGAQTLQNLLEYADDTPIQGILFLRKIELY